MRVTLLLFSSGARRRGSELLAVGVLASCLLAGAPRTQADEPQSPAADSKPTMPAKAPAAKTKAAATKTKSPATKVPPTIARSQRAEMWYAASFGIDQMHVRSVSSGQSIEFRYRVLDSDKAALLTDRNASPHLIDQESGKKLEVPVVEQIGSLRQTAKPQVGKEYFMLFNNPGKVVKPGKRVDLTCGMIHLRGLIVE